MPRTARRTAQPGIHANPPTGEETPDRVVYVAVREAFDPGPSEFLFAAEELPTDETVKRAFARHLREILGIEANSRDVIVDQVCFREMRPGAGLSSSIEDAMGIEKMRARIYAPA